MNPTPRIWGTGPLIAVAVAASGGIAALLAGAGPLKENLDLPFDAAGEVEEEEAPEIVVFYGGVYEADGFFYCLDASLSMADGEWKRLQAELLRNLRDFSSSVEFGFVFFDQDVKSYPEDRRPMKATPAAKAGASAMVGAVQPGNWTCLREGLVAAIEMGQRSTASRRAIIVMSDGKPTCPGTDFVTYRESIFTAARASNQKRIPIHTIGIGSDIDGHFLQRLAAEHGGSYRRVR
jgi:hypothetical protein